MTTEATDTVPKADSTTEEWRPGEGPQGTTTTLTYEHGAHDAWSEVCEALGEAWFPMGGNPHEEMKDILRTLVRERAQRAEETAAVRDMARETIGSDVVRETTGMVPAAQALADKVHYLVSELGRAQGEADTAKSTKESLYLSLERERQEHAVEQKRVINLIHSVMDAVEPSLRPTYLLDDGGPLEKLVGLLVHLRAVALESRLDGQRYAFRLESEVLGQVGRFRPQPPGASVVEAVREVVNEALRAMRAQQDQIRIERAYQRLHAVPMEALPYCDAQLVYVWALTMLDELRKGTAAAEPIAWIDWVASGGTMGHALTPLFELFDSLDAKAKRAKRKRKARRFHRLAKGVRMALDAVQDEQDARTEAAMALGDKGAR